MISNPTHRLLNWLHHHRNTRDGMGQLFASGMSADLLPEKAVDGWRTLEKQYHAGIEMDGMSIAFAYMDYLREYPPMLVTLSEYMPDRDAVRAEDLVQDLRDIK